MGHIVRGHRWDMPIPFKIGSSLSEIVRNRINNAISIIESQTNVRFKYRSDQNDYILFKKAPAGQTWSSSSELGDESGFLGIGGGRQEIELVGNASLSIVLHEICHAVGMAHEHQRRDRDSHINVRYDHIDDEHEDQYETKPGDETRSWGPYDQDSIMHYEGDEFGMYTWSDGWTSLAFHQIGSTDLLLALRESNGLIHVDRMDFGVVGPIIHQENWTDGYTQFVPFSTINAAGVRRHFIFLLKKSNGYVKIHRLRAAGIGELVASYDWSPNWTNVAFFESNGQTFLILLKRHTGRFEICLMNSWGSFDRVIYRDEWSAGYTQVRPFSVIQADGSRRWFLFCLKEGNGSVYIDSLNPDGTIGGTVAHYNWTHGWSSVAFVEESARTSLILLKKSNGHIHVHQMNSDGTVGPRTDTKDWSSGYTTLAAHVPHVGTPYVLFHKSDSGEAHIHYFSGGSISSEIKPPTIIPFNGLSMGDTGRSGVNLLTAGDIDALNKLAGVAFQPLRPIVIAMRRQARRSAITYDS